VANLRDFSVNIIGLSKKVHQFSFGLTDEFFKEYSNEVISKGKLDAKVNLDKRETFIEVEFSISGLVELLCDRSLEPFDHPLTLKRKLIFKYGEEPQEMSDEIIIITRDQESLDLGQYMYEFILLAIPLKKIHPSLLSEYEKSETQGIIYSTSTNIEKAEEPDPRWDVLKKIKK
jgi:uncharacterized metal-binding protein YceD (DUF177 family)